MFSANWTRFGIFFPDDMVRLRVVSSEISEISGNFQKFFEEFFHFIRFSYDRIKKISVFLTNNLPDLCVLTLFRKKNNLFLAWLAGISVNLNENC